MSSPRQSGVPEVPFGAPMRHAHFAFSPTYNPLNHGSYGTHPVSVRAAHLSLRAELEAAPDPFIALDFHSRLTKPRALVAEMLHCDADELVFVPNATTGIDTVLKNIFWQPGDVIMCYEVVYESVWFGMQYVKERYGVETHMVRFEWPISDDDLIATMINAARDINAQPGKRLRMSVIDTIVSGPGMRVPYERLVPALQSEGALVVVDGAHGIGHVDIDLESLSPDFFVTNLHKWLFVPRGCAAFYVPKKHQGLIRTTLPTSHGFRPRGVSGTEEGDNEFVAMFDFTGTADTTNWLCVEAALKFRTDVCGGEFAIQEYCQSIARRGGAIAARILGTDVMDMPGSCMRQCNFANVRMPLEVHAFDDDPEDYWDGTGRIDARNDKAVQAWIRHTGCVESGIYCQVFSYRGHWWWRVSGMIYVEDDDFRRGALVLKGLCERVRKGEFLPKRDRDSLRGEGDADSGGASSTCSPVFTPVSNEGWS